MTYRLKMWENPSPFVGVNTSVTRLSARAFPIYNLSTDQ